MNRFSLKLISYFIIFSGFTFLLLGYKFSIGIKNVLTRWGTDIQITAYLNEGTGEEELSELKNLLNSEVEFKYKIFNQEAVINEFIKNSKGFGNDVLSRDDIQSVMQARVDIQANKTIFGTFNKENVSGLVKKLQDSGLVDELTSGQDWLQKYSTTLKTFMIFGAIFFVIASTVVGLVIGNIVKTEIFDQRERLEVLELLGASKWFIIKPLIKEGLYSNCFSMMVALFISDLLIRVFKTSFSDVGSVWGLSESISQFSFFEISFFIVIALVIGAAGVYFSTQSLSRKFALSRKGLK